MGNSSYGFYGSGNLLSIDTPDSAHKIGDFVFKDCSQLTSIKIPEESCLCRWMAFHSCTGLKSIIIPVSVQSIGERHSTTVCACELSLFQKTSNVLGVPSRGQPQERGMEHNVLMCVVSGSSEKSSHLNSRSAISSSTEMSLVEEFSHRARRTENTASAMISSGERNT